MSNYSRIPDGENETKAISSRATAPLKSKGERQTPPQGFLPATAPLGGEDGAAPEAAEFDRGTVDMRAANDQLLHQMQPPLSAGAKACRGATVALAGLSIIGLPYVIAKTKLIQQGELGLARGFDGKVRILKAGWNIQECVFCDVRRYPLTENVIIHGPMHVLRILPGCYGLGEQRGSPVVLEPGLHVLNDPLFRWVRSVAMTDFHIHVGTTHIITIPSNRIGLATVNGEAFFLEPGRHFINNARFRYERMEATTNEHISFGSRNRIIVPSGRVGLAWDHGQPLLLQPGRVYNFVSPLFSYDGSRDVGDELISHGSIKIVTVRDGQFGISYDDGQLAILPAGRHILDKPTHVFGGLLSAGQRTLAISEVTSMSSDNVGLTFDAAITIQVVDAKKAVTMLSGSGSGNGGDGGGVFRAAGLYATITDKAKLALSIIIGNNRLNRTFRSTQRKANPEEKEEGGAAAGAGDYQQQQQQEEEEEDNGSFKQHVHDVFMSSFSEDMLSSCGVLVVDMSVEDVRITNPELAAAMARGAVARTELEKAKIEGAVRDTNAAAEQRAEVTRAEGEARAMSILAAAESERIRQLDAAIASVGEVTQQRELIRAAGEVLAGSSNSLILGNSISDVARVVGGAGGLGGMLRRD